MKNIPAINRLADKFSTLPGVGKKSALRYAYKIVGMSDEDAEDFIEAIKEVKEKVHLCSSCGAFTDLPVCEICSERDSSTICVVKEPKDVDAFERLGEYRGVYHVLHGQLSPLNGIGPDDLRIKELLARLDDCKEVIIALNPDVEGDATAMYISRLIKPLGIKVTRLARGIPSGSELEYADEATLSEAFNARKEF
ncbi:MAG: recombination protein RecR [Clostridia bacterium]|nr:recombination protein RecR [Clostridia bacterium]